MPESFTAIDELTRRVQSGDLGTCDTLRFADVAIVTEQPGPGPQSFYPEDRFVVTRHSQQLAWLFSELVPIFSTVDAYALWKEELFGRLGNAANWYLASNVDASDRELALAVLCEAYMIADEVNWSGGAADALLVTVDNRITDDARNPLAASRPADAASAEAWLTRRGVL